MRETAAIFDIKSTRLDVLVVVLKDANTELLNAALYKRFGKMQDASSVPLLLELTRFKKPEDISLEHVLPIFKQYNLNIIGIRHIDQQFQTLATKYGLAFYLSSNTKEQQPQHAEQKKDEIKPHEKIEAQKIEPEKTVMENIPAKELSNKEPPEVSIQKNKITPSEKKRAQPEIRTTMVVDKPVRTGQQIYAKNADLIVLEMVSAGAEILADGNIHVYAPLRGRALAGVKGDKKARIFVQCMQAELVSVAGVYRTIEQNLPQDIANKAAQIFVEQDKLVIKALNVK
ncbi:septum site-determining protein MinC [Neisseria sp. Ec49-e6-T10]|uniref:septum site-determining protein MinC n=1 Tax=Neisseria sp. Ec49-e6-T10 TaxID=3140744 RepID=UPI003EBFCC35